MELDSVHTGRLEVKDQRQPFGHLAIPLIFFTRHVPQEIPANEYAKLSGPLQHPGIHDSRGAFVYEPQHLIMHALDAGLKPANSGISYQLHLLSFQIGLGLEKKRKWLL